MTRICLIDLVKGQQDKSHFIGTSKKKIYGSGVPVTLWEPFSLEYIGGYLKSKGHKVLILQQRNSSEKQLLNRCINFNPKIIGFSVYTYNLKEIIKLNRKIKKKLPRTLSIFGGYHPSGDLNTIKEKSVDFLVIGEGEIILNKIAEAKNDKEIENIRGVVYKKEDKIIINRPTQQEDFSKFPWPLRDNKILKQSRIAPLFYPIPSKQSGAAMISYSRGCPHKCSFCASSLIYPNLKYRGARDVLKEIKYLKKKFNVNAFFFTDLTFNANRERVYELCSLIKKEELDINWFAYISCEADRETLKIMKEAGCSRIGIGVESVLNMDLKKTKGYQNYKKTKRTIKIANSLGILTRGYLCIGFPEHSHKDILEFKKFLLDLPLDQIRIGFITPFVGTVLRKKYQNSCSYESDKYTTEEPVITKSKLSQSYLLKLRDKMIKEYYSNPRYIIRIKEKVKRFPNLKSSFEYFFEYLRSYGVNVPYLEKTSKQNGPL